MAVISVMSPASFVLECKSFEIISMFMDISNMTKVLMNKLLKPYVVRLAVFMVVLVFFPVAITHAKMNPNEMLVAPNEVGIGQPFIVRFSSSEHVGNITVRWKDRTVIPTVSHENGISSAIILLGTRLSSEPGQEVVRVEAGAGGRTWVHEKAIAVVEHEYDSETLSVSRNMIVPPKSVEERIKKERERALKAIRTVSEERMWDVPFSLPVDGKMLSRFGLYRVYNGEHKSRHKGLDFRAYLGTPIRTIAPGRVVLVGDSYYAGNCVYVDHGNGVVSSYVHMSKVVVKEGDMVRSGQKIGLSGASGRTTGAHLHLSVYVQGISIDPEPLFSLGEPAN